MSDKIIPVLVLNNDNDAKKIADIAMKYHVSKLEITLRTPNALSIIEALSSYAPDIDIGAGTILSADQALSAKNAGASFFVSPGMTVNKINNMQPYYADWYAGVATISEAMLLREYNIKQAKFFPAILMGGVAWLKNIQSLLPDMMFFPTGGLNSDNINEFCALDNVCYAGGTWLASSALLNTQDFKKIEQNFYNIYG